MKDEQRLQNKIELLLDHRQIFFLFFASAVVVGLVFALGVVVGKRIDSPTTPRKPTDPLALLDQMGKEEGEEGLTFHEALTHDRGQGKKAAKKAEEGTGTASKQGEANPPPSADSSEAAEKESAGAHGKGKALPAILGASEPKGRASENPPKKQDNADKSGKSDKQDKQEKQDKIVKQDKFDKHEKHEKAAKPSPAAAESSESGTYTLQLNAFQERKEADQFMQKLRDAGMKPYMISTTIPQKGVWYRVRVGSYDKWEDALAAKQAFEKSQKIIAYVAKN
jgi:DedD protein